MLALRVFRETEMPDDDEADEEPNFMHWETQLNRLAAFRWWLPVMAAELLLILWRVW